MILTFLPFTLWAQSPSGQTVQAPKQVWSKSGLSYWSYWLSKKLVVDLDQDLRELNLQPSVCVFRNAKNLQDSPHYDLGRCFYEAFLQSMKTDQFAGVIYSWVKTPAGQSQQPIEIYWRPPQGGWKNMLIQAFQMKFEKEIYNAVEFLNSKTELNIENKVYFSKFIAGEIFIVFPNDPLFHEALNQSKLSQNKLALSYTKKIDSLQFYLDKAKYKDGVIYYQGQLNIIADHDDLNQLQEIVLETNVNPLQKKRPFMFKGKTRLDQKSDTQSSHSDRVN